MGIIDSKTRLFDTIITQQGRRQLATGKMKIEFVSFTDSSSFYTKDANSGSVDPADRLYLEACDLPQDMITFEANDSGRLAPYKGSSLGVADGKVLSGSTDVYLTIVTGSAFVSTSERLLDSTIENFRKLQLIRTDNAILAGEREFNTNINEIKFYITNNFPFREKQLKTACIDKIESIFQDKRLSNALNFKYLPPVNSAANYGGTVTSLGDFPMIGQKSTPMTYDQIRSEISRKDSSVIEFNTSTLRSNIICQIFELKNNELLKLDVIDYGEMFVNDDVFPNKRVFFVGKVFIDSFGIQTFVNIFTLVFEN